MNGALRQEAGALQKVVQKTVKRNPLLFRYFLGYLQRPGKTTYSHGKMADGRSSHLSRR
jgi:hypothetical protein